MTPKIIDLEKALARVRALERPSFILCNAQFYRFMRLWMAYPALIRAYRHLSRSGDAAVERYAFQRIDDLQRLCNCGRH